MEHTILVVDDDRTNLALAQKILTPRYRIAASNSGRGALKYLENHHPALILLDINMPDLDGFEVMEQLRQKEEIRSIPVIFLTADNLAETEVKCFRMGAMDFVTKPFVPDILLSRVDKTIELDQYRHNLEQMVKEQAEKITEDATRISRIQDSVIVGMANLIESRDGSTGKHVKNTQMYVRMIADELRSRNLFAEELTEEYIEDLCKAAPLHDVGKIKIPDSILQKPGRLTPEHKIPLAARIMAVADVFDALYEERCYKPPVRPIEKIMEIMGEGRGTQFDPVILDAFMEMLPALKEVLGIE
ncbi:MAG: response regulator [Lachnospiraceae bacterium]|nr:response regulator [Lachnospiraceae bacterium]